MLPAHLAGEQAGQGIQFHLALDMDDEGIPALLEGDAAHGGIGLEDVDEQDRRASRDSPARVRMETTSCVRPTMPAKDSTVRRGRSAGRV